MNTQDWSPLGWSGWIPLQSKGLSNSPKPQFKSSNSSALSFLYSPTLTSIYDHWKNLDLTRWTSVDKVMSLLRNMLSRLVITLLPRSQSVWVTQSCLTLWDPLNRSTPSLSVHLQHPEFTQTHVHWVGDAIQPSHTLLSPSPPAFNLSQHQGLFKRVSPSHQVAKILEFQLQHQSFQLTPRTDFL